jgi:tetratricopeptide (TPR) repeat protein
VRRLPIDRRFVVVFVIGAVLLVFTGPYIWQKTVLNLFAIKVASAVMLSSNVEQEQLLNSIPQGDCRASWLAGVLANTQQLDSVSKAQLQQAVTCSPTNIAMLRALFPQDVALAALAVEQWPQNATAYFWAGKSSAVNGDTSAAVGYYRQGLRLDPYDGLSWLELGDLLAETDPQSAIEAYLQACYNGDPGSNGCWRAGQVAESLGDTQAAIRYYRYSAWSGALDRAALVESQITSP